MKEISCDMVRIPLKYFQYEAGVLIKRYVGTICTICSSIKRVIFYFLFMER
jgi:hypothetical protein